MTNPLLAGTIMLSLLSGVVHAAQISVTVNGVYDVNASGAGFYASIGTESLHASSAAPMVDTYTYGAWEYVWNEEIQNYDYVYIERTETLSGSERTLYSITVPDTWLGHSITFSWDSGINYTSYTPFVTDGAEFTYESHDHSQSGALPGSSYSNFGVYPNKMLLGQWWSDPNRALITLNSWDNVDPNWPSVGMDFLASAPDAFWRWMHPSSNGGGVQVAMDLDFQHKLTLRGRTYPMNKIVFDPEAGAITINGNSVMTTSYASANYVAKTGGAMGSGAVSFYGGPAIGIGARSQGMYNYWQPNPDKPSIYAPALSVAIGSAAFAETRGSIAIGQSSRTQGDYALAIGGDSQAIGTQSISIGVGARSDVNANNSLALGAFSNAKGVKSTALGYRTTAQGYGQAVVGVNNVPVGNASDPVALDSEVFVVGGGSYEWSGSTAVSIQRNSFTVKRGGDTRVMGRLAVEGTGESTISGNLRVQGVIRVAPAGDITMGIFMAEPPQP